MPLFVQEIISQRRMTAVFPGPSKRTMPFAVLPGVPQSLTRQFTTQTAFDDQIARGEVPAFMGVNSSPSTTIPSAKRFSNVWSTEVSGDGTLAVLAVWVVVAFSVTVPSPPAERRTRGKSTTTDPVSYVPSEMTTSYLFVESAP